jgi:hypothetical protein
VEIPEKEWANLPDDEVIVPGTPTEVLKRLGCP